jgi:hypothetical protein
MISGCSKRMSLKAAVSEKTRRTLGSYVESLSDARTTRDAFFNSLARWKG